MPKRNPSSPVSSGLLDSWGRSNNRRHPDGLCAECGRSFQPKRATSRYCSRPCMWANNGKNQRTVSECWWVDAKGYIQGFVRRDGMKIRVKSHRVIAERLIGRPLLPTEDVHHVNGDKQDNRPENLQVIDHGAHSSLSNRTRSRRKATGAEGTRP